MLEIFRVSRSGASNLNMPDTFPHVNKQYMVITNTSTQGLASEEVNICQQ